MVVAVLQQTSKQLQAAAAQLLAGQLQVRQLLRKPPQMTAFAAWLVKHAGLLQELSVQVAGSSDHGHSWHAPAVRALEDAMRQAGPGRLQLQSFVMQGMAAPSRMLRELSAAQLTRLQADTSIHSYWDALSKVRALTNLRDLTLHDNRYSAKRRFDPGQLTSLQQLTRLQIGALLPSHLV
jgi:hypothetical protein